MKRQRLGVMQDHPRPVALGIGKADKLHPAAHQHGNMGGFAGAVGHLGKDRLDDALVRNGFFAQRGKPQDGRADPVFARRFDLFDKPVGFQFGHQPVAGRLVHPGKPRDVGKPDLRTHPREEVEQLQCLADSAHLSVPFVAGETNFASPRPFLLTDRRGLCQSKFKPTVQIMNH